MSVTLPYRLLTAGVAIVGLGAGLVACDGENAVRITKTTTTSASNDVEPGVLKVVEGLKCPETLGVLTRKGFADPGGAACTYGGPRGAEVVLYLVKLEDRSAEDVLREYERRVSSDMPQAAMRIDARQTENGTEEATVAAPGVNIQAKGDDASVKLPGLQIETRGDSASVRIAGINIQSKDGEGVRTEKSSVKIDSNGETTQIRTQAPGDATRASFILADDDVPAGAWRQVGFEARGPAGGPLVIATVRSKSRHDRVFETAKDLIALNVGD